MGLRQVGGSSNEVCPSLTSEFESPLKSDSRSELQEKKGKMERKQDTSEDAQHGGIHYHSVQQAPESALTAAWATDKQMFYRQS